MRPPDSFLVRRFRRGIPFGLHFTAGLGLAGLGLAFFTWVATQVNRDGPVPQFDRRVAAEMKEHADEHPFLLAFFRGVTHAGGVLAMVVLGVGGAFFLLLRREYVLMAGWIVAAGGGGLVNLGLKTFVDRPRPGAELRDDAVTERNESYPSGHAMGSVIGYGSVGYVWLLRVRSRRHRALILACLVALVVLIGVSRIYLRAHWLSDVCGGYAIGICWLVLCFSVVEGVRRSLAPG
jgi:undecaprenyl-diphosphatase